MAVKRVKGEVKDQLLTKRYCLYNGDCCSVLPGIRAESVGFSVFSPPFSDLFSYSDDLEDMGNCASYSDFFTHFEFLAKELFRVIMPGRNVAIHCMDLPTFKRNGDEIGLRDFSGDIIRCFQGVGFTFASRHCIWKDPLIAATRTKAIGLAHKQLVKDSARIRMGIPDYILVMSKPGENPKPIHNPRGLTEYHGSRQVPFKFDKYLPGMEQVSIVGDNPYDPSKDKRAHWIWQQYASPVWFDIRQGRVLPYRQARGEEDQKHICPLQLDVIERCVQMWSAPDDVVLSPFLGVGSEIYVAVKNGRKGVGIELKESYYKQAVRNVRMASQQESIIEQE
jgi:hypothetical protein